MHHLQNPEFEVKALLRTVAQLVVRPQHDLQKARQILFAERFGDARDSGAFVSRDLQ